MKTENLLRFFIENGIRWVESQRDAHRSSARDLTKTERSALAPFFDINILNLAKIKMVPGIENPGFYSELEDMKVPGLLDFSTAAGITFRDTIVLSELYSWGSSVPGSLIFHELVHVVQYDILGVAGFIERYVRGWTENGLDYFAIPLEIHAFELQRLYETSGKQDLSVEAEVVRRLEETS